MSFIQTLFTGTFILGKIRVFMIRSMLVPADFSNNAMKAVTYAAAIA
jgi:hypothetical protein